MPWQPTRLSGGSSVEVAMDQGGREELWALGRKERWQTVLNIPLAEFVFIICRNKSLERLWQCVVY